MTGSEVSTGGEPASPPWRFFDLSYATGIRQAALTEALLLAVAGGAPPALRIYSWTGPTVFIGVGEPASDVDRARCEALGIPIVRRLSGGTAVRHDRHWVSVELIARTDHPRVPSDVLGAYRAFAAPIADAMARLGVVTHRVTIDEARSRVAEPALAAACFGGVAPFEIVARHRKLVGLAQVRRRGAVVLHAAIGLRFDVPALAAVISGAGDSFETQLRAIVTDLEREAGHAVDAPELAASLRHAFTEWLRDPLGPDMPTAEELGAATLLAGEKYGNPAWTFRR